LWVCEDFEAFDFAGLGLEMAPARKLRWFWTHSSLPSQGRLTQVEGGNSPKSKFKVYPIRRFHLCRPAIDRSRRQRDDALRGRLRELAAEQRLP